MNLWRNEARKKIIQNKPQNEITWDFLGNSIINSYIKHNNDVCILDNRLCKTFAEMKFGNGVEPYRKFYFESNFCKSDLSQDTFVLFLHNSWTPLYYKNLNNYLFFLSNCTLSNILFETLGYNEILPLINGLNYHNKKLQDRIQILEKENARLNARLNNIINSNNNRTFLSYRAHISNIGWVEYLTEKSNIGCCDINTKSRCNHIEAINISSSNHEFQLKYKVKIKNNGWSQFIDDGKDAGTTGKSLPLQGFVLFFDNEKYLIKYRVFWSDHTVSEWVKNGTIVESKDLDIIGMQFSVEMK